MPPAARINDMHICPVPVPPMVCPPHVGGPILMGCPTVMIGGMPAARVGDMAACLGPPVVGPPGPPDAIAVGSSTVMIGGMPAARVGDATAHGGMVTVGCPTVMIGG